MSKFWINHYEIYEQLKEVKIIMSETIRSSETFFNETVDYLMETGGKMIRPAFLILGSEFGDHQKLDKYNINKLAAVTEILHLATLIHDDIIDEAFLRRGKETIQSKYSKEYAVYMGDYLFTQCFVMLSDQQPSKEVVQLVSKGFARICKAEMMQNHLRYNLNIKVNDYLKIIRGKTAALIALSLGVGAYQAGASEKLSKKLGKIGLNIGMAFQLVDDLLDYTGDSAKIGKEVQSDIFSGYYTLPLILGLQSDFKVDIKQILNQTLLEPKDISQLITLTHECGAIRETERMAKNYTVKALKGINDLPACKGKDVLLDVVPKLLFREY